MRYLDIANRRTVARSAGMEVVIPPKKNRSFNNIYEYLSLQVMPTKLVNTGYIGI